MCGRPRSCLATCARRPAIQAYARAIFDFRACWRMMGRRRRSPPFSTPVGLHTIATGEVLETWMRPTGLGQIHEAGGRHTPTMRWIHGPSVVRVTEDMARMADREPRLYAGRNGPQVPSTTARRATAKIRRAMCRSFHPPVDAEHVEQIVIAQALLRARSQAQKQMASRDDADDDAVPWRDESGGRRDGAKPAIAPEIMPSTDGLRRVAHSIAAQVSAPAQAARCVAVIAITAREFAPAPIRH